MHVALASLNNGHNFDLRACCASVRSSSKPSLVPTRPLRPCNVAWRSSLVVNLNSIVSKCTHIVEVETFAIIGRCCIVVMTLACNLIWPYNSSMLSCYTKYFSVSLSLASKAVRCKLSLRYSCLGVSTKVSTTWLTTWRKFLAITLVHLGSSAKATLVVTTVATLCSMNSLTSRLPASWTTVH